MSDPFDAALLKGHRASYVEELRGLAATANPVALAICQRWHGATFGHPGYGDTNFVRGQLEWAGVALDAIRCYNETANAAL